MSEQESGRRCPGCGKTIDESQVQCECGFSIQHEADDDHHRHLEAVEEMFEGNTELDDAHWEQISHQAESHPAEHGAMLEHDYDAGDEESEDKQPPSPRKKHHHILALVILGHIAVLVAIGYVASDKFAQRRNSQTVVIREPRTNGDIDEGGPRVRTEFVTRPGTTARAIEERINAAGLFCNVDSLTESRGRVSAQLSRAAAWDMSALRSEIESDAVNVVRSALVDSPRGVDSVRIEVRFPIGEETRPPWPVVFSLECSRDQAARALGQSGGEKEIIRRLGGKFHEKLERE